jgi:hypothetical protein
VAGAVDKAEPEDRVVLAEEAIGEIAAEQREEVHADHKAVKDVGCGELARGLVRDRQQQRRDQERRQDVPHPVEAEPLASLVRDDERDLRRHPRFGVSVHGPRILTKCDALSIDTVLGPDEVLHCSDEALLAQPARLLAQRDGCRTVAGRDP